MSTQKLELISHPLCPFVHRTAAFLTEHGVPYEARHIDLQAKPDWFLAVSPRGKVPVLVVDGTPIFESAVILEYAAETYAPELIADDPLQRARQRMWVEVSSDVMMGQYKIAVAGTPADRNAAVAATRDTLKRFEPLVRGPFEAGDRPGLLDFAIGPALIRLERLDAMLGLGIYKGMPKIAEWSTTIGERPAFRSTLVQDFDERFRALVNGQSVAA
jgi:glutathione S-transferase